MCLIRIGEGYFLAALYIVGQRIDVYDILGCGSEPFDYGIKPQLGFYFFSFALRNIFIGKPLQDFFVLQIGLYFAVLASYIYNHAGVGLKADAHNIIERFPDRMVNRTLLEFAVHIPAGDYKSFLICFNYSYAVPPKL